jgi:hypothetical protein
VQEHQDALQLRSAGDRRGDPGGVAAVRANEAAFDRAIDETAAVARRLIDSLTTNATPKNREEVAAAAKARSAERFADAR